MRRFNSKSITGLLILTAVVSIALLPACRKEQDPLDRNRAPETFLTIAPPETTNTDYSVHVYWYGKDRDGIVTRYMWHKSDTLKTLNPILEPDIALLDWNPEARKSDYETGTFITATDTVFIFKGFDVTTGALVNRQAFHIVAIDDGGKMDKTPARIQFFAKVKCVPEVGFWFETNTIPGKPYVPGILDTISMFEPFCVEFCAKTCNNMVNGYQWIYGGKVYPDFDNDGSPDWYIPTYDPPETVQVCIENQGISRIAQGDFYFRVTARDEAGARSRADIVTGEGVFQLVVNHDPDTKIRMGECFYIDGAGNAIEAVVDFDDNDPDTLPYNSRLRMHYGGWDDKKDSLEFPDPPIPMRFQFKFERWGYGLLDGGISSYRPSWMPEKKAEDTNCNADEDSTTMMVGSYDYLFLAKAFDEQYRYDHTPDTVSFVGNFPPRIDKISIAYDSIAGSSLELADIKGDTVYIAIGYPMMTRLEEDYVASFSNTYDSENEVFNQFFKLYINGSGHDDHRDPPGSGIRGWWYSIEAEEDLYYRGEEEWLYDFDPDTILQEITFRLVVPRDPDFTKFRPDSNFVNEQPLWMGDQDLIVVGSDLFLAEQFKEGIRAVSPVYVDDDPCNELITPGRWVTQNRGIANYARSDSYSGWFYIKLVY